jgi:hypothetical protein
VQFFAQELVVAASALAYGGASAAASITVAGTTLTSHFGEDGVAGDPGVVVGALGPRALPDYLDYARAGLLDAATQLRRYHSGLLYGDASLGLAPTIYHSQAQADLLFQHRCLRTGGSSCVAASHPYYRITTGGLHALVEYYITQAGQLANQTVAALAAGSDTAGSTSVGVTAVTGSSAAVLSGLRNPRYEFVWAVAETDLADGLATSLQIYSSEAAATTRAYAVATGIIFGIFVVAVAVVYFALFRPYIARIAAETHRAASLLRSLPTDIDLGRLQGEMDAEGQQEGAVLAAAAAAHTASAANGREGASTSVWRGDNAASEKKRSPQLSRGPDDAATSKSPAPREGGVTVTPAGEPRRSVQRSRASAESAGAAMASVQASGGGSYLSAPEGGSGFAGSTFEGGGNGGLAGGFVDSGMADGR